MPGGHNGYRHRRGPNGYNLYPFPVAPDYAVVDPNLALKSGCNCSGGSSSGAFAGISDWVKSNPLPALLGAFAIGWLVMGKKGGF